MIGRLFRRRPLLAVAALLALTLAGCKDMGTRDYYIFGQGSAKPATEAPQTMTRPGQPATPGTSETPAPDTTVEGAPLAPPTGAPGAEQRPIVGLLLPLSGPNAALGRVLMDAATVAQLDVGDQGFVLLPRDTGGTPDGAAAAAQSALAAGARLIVGPLFASEVPAVANVARPANVNVISFSNDRTVAGPGVYVLGLSPQGQIERVITFARSRGLQNYAGLLPSNAFGAAVEEALRRTVANVGGQVTAIERYDPAAADATPIVRRLAAYEQRYSDTVAKRKELQERDDDAARAELRRLDAAPAGAVGFDAVVLPDFGDRLLSIAPLLPYYDIDPAKVRFLGSAFWEDGRVTREPALAGAWFAAPPPTARADFVQRFKQLYNREPPRIATIVYDAVALAAVLARGPNGPDFSAGMIANPNGFAGTDGIFRFRPDGTAERGFAVLEVRREGFRVISPAPNDFRELTR